MLCFSEYSSPIGKITIASDGKAISELKLSGQSASENFFSAPVCKNDPRSSPIQSAGLIFTFPAKSPTFFPSFFLAELRFKPRFGICCCRFLTAKQPPTALLRQKLPSAAEKAECPPGRWAVQSAATRFQLSFPATGLLAQTEILRVITAA